MTFFKKWISYIFSIPIHTCDSELNGTLRVKLESGRYVLHANRANYSFASLHYVFQRAFKKIPLKKIQPKSALLLGMGAGSVISILKKEYKLNINIIAVEYDPVIVDIAKQYFNIDQYHGLDIVVEDAFDFVKNKITGADLVIVDLFTDLLMPSEALSSDFIDSMIRLTNSRGYLIINYIIKSDNQASQLKKILNQLEKTGITKTIRSGTNRVLIWEAN